MSQPTWAQISDAFHAAITSASGLNAARVIWAYQNANQPALDYIDMQLGAAATVGRDWVNERYDGARDPGEQVVLEVGGLREVPLSLRAWSAAVVEANAEQTARALLDAVVTRLQLPGARGTLAAVGVTPFDPGPVQWVPSVVSIGFRGRATCDIRCRVPARALAEYADWIARVEGTATVEAGGESISVPIIGE